MEVSESAAESAPSGRRDTALALLLFALTLGSTLYAGARQQGFEHPLDLWRGYAFALPLLAILLCHELGHYVAARVHGVDVSPPFFIPLPFQFALAGTMGAVIRMRAPIRTRAALLDIGAAGPLAGLLVCLPLLAYGIVTSEVQPIAPDAAQEGHSLLYTALLWLLKGPIPEGSDLVLSPTAFAGWVGLLVTMINLVPAGELDGGLVAYALLGDEQARYSRYVRRALMLFGVALGLEQGLQAWLAGAAPENLGGALLAGAHWILWGLVLSVMSAMNQDESAPLEGSALGRGRRQVAWLTLMLFPLLFMPIWLSTP